MPRPCASTCVTGWPATKPREWWSSPTRSRATPTENSTLLRSPNCWGAVTMDDPARLLDWLDLERIDRDIFRGPPTVWPREGSLYGGLVAAQALMAAARTAPEGREPHSLHGYYLRPGDPKVPVVYSVDRDRDGRSFSARRVVAIQDGQVIWDMSCSFHERVEGPEYAPGADPGVRPPETSAQLVA